MEAAETLHNMALLVRLVFAIIYMHHGCTARPAHACLVLSGRTALGAAVGAHCLVPR
jgi:hypothetical protein